MLNRALRCAIVDDDAADTLLLRTFLRKVTGDAWTYAEYADYESAAAALETGGFDIAFVDLNISGKDGLDLIRDAVARGASYPTVVVSALSDDDLQDAAIGAGAYDFLPKDDMDEKTVKRMLRHVFSAFRKTEELRRMANQALHGSAIKSAFLACMSHDLRTPLNAIIGFSDVLFTAATGPRSQERTQEYARIISESAGHLLELIDGLLDLAKIEQEKYTLHCKWVPLEDFLLGQVRFLTPIAGERDVTLDLRTEDGGSYLHCDERALRQIFTNLLSNAVKFSDPGSSVVVTTALRDGNLHLGVADSGAGMTTAETRMAVMPFGQVTENPEIAREGTGLGLAIVKGLVEAHQGELLIHSRKGVGTRVSVVFPAVRVSEQGGAAARPVRTSAA